MIIPAVLLALLIPCLAFSLEPMIGTVGLFQVNQTVPDAPVESSVGFMKAFFATLSVIIVSELGDKTFFIAAILAMRNSRASVFCGAATALLAMTLLSAILGKMATQLIPYWLTLFASSLLFLVFGLKLLFNAWHMSPEEELEELEEVSQELSSKPLDNIEYVHDLEAGGVRVRLICGQGLLYWLKRMLNPAFVQSLTLTFLGEWGDRSQISTFVMASREDVVGVSAGAFLGHTLCTGLAVIGGRFVAERISVRAVTCIGGIVFVLFGISAFMLNWNDIWPRPF